MNDSTNLNIALVGCDTSHALHFTRLLNDNADADHIPGARVVAAVPDPYGAIDGSGEKALKHAAEIEARHGVVLHDSIGALPENIDAILILGTDGARHLPQFLECAERRVPIFIDKPFTLGSEAAQHIFSVGSEVNVPVMSTSSLRYEDNFRAALAACAGEPITGADCYGYVDLRKSAPGFFWYAIHVVELLCAAMGTGLEEVSLTHRENYDLITGVWNDGRIGTVRGSRRPHYIYGGALHTATRPIAFEAPEDTSHTYVRLMEQVVQFARTGVSPISPQETLEVIRFLEMAEQLRLASQGKPRNYNRE